MSLGAVKIETTQNSPVIFNLDICLDKDLLWEYQNHNDITLPLMYDY